MTKPEKAGLLLIGSVLGAVLGALAAVAVTILDGR